MGYRHSWGIINGAIALVCIVAAMPGRMEGKTLDREDIAVGNIVEMGLFEQDDTHKGQEPIEWIVLEVDYETDRALLLSKYSISCWPFSDRPGEVDWEDSFVRDQLNGEFLQMSFSEEERDQILTAEVRTRQRIDQESDDSETEDRYLMSQDQVFLLSDEEVLQYYPKRKERQCEAVPLLAAEADEAETGDGEAGGPVISDLTGTIFWWLRTPGSDGGIQCVGAEGSVVEAGYLPVRSDFGIRPAVWVRLQ